MDTTHNTNQRHAIERVGGPKLHGGTFDNRRSDWDGAWIKSSWDASDHDWCHLGYPQLCDSCLRAYGLDTDWDSPQYHLSHLGLQNNNNSMENEVMISDLLGTTWWSLLVFAAGMAAGMYFKTWILSAIKK